MSFKAAWWLPGPHLQTVWPTISGRKVALDWFSERIELPDHDFIDLAWAKANVNDSNKPLVMLLHGLGGSIDSKYAKGLLKSFTDQGWRAVLMHFRGCSGEPNRLARSYHSGEINDLTYVINLLKQRNENVDIAVVGVSLGGNVLLNYLAQQPKQSLIDAAVAISVPYQLDEVANYIGTGFSKIYQWHLIRKLHQELAQKMQTVDFPISINNHQKLQTFWEFDENITAPLHGFNSAAHYYQQVSSRQYLHLIDTPTLLLHAKDDPFMTANVIPTLAELSAKVELEVTDNGGHVGFIAGNIPAKPLYWLEKRVPEFLSKQFSLRAVIL